jgi:putative endonuclease
MSFPRRRESSKILNMLYYTYILASKKNGTLYIGVTSNLEKRIYEHGLIDGFTKKYNVKNLVYFETTDDVNSAIQREKQLKKWNRAWKIRLTEQDNPNWDDLSKDWIPACAGMT